MKDPIQSIISFVGKIDKNVAVAAQKTKSMIMYVLGRKNRLKIRTVITVWSYLKNIPEPRPIPNPAQKIEFKIEALPLSQPTLQAAYWRKFAIS